MKVLKKEQFAEKHWRGSQSQLLSRAKSSDLYLEWIVFAVGKMQQFSSFYKYEVLVWLHQLVRFDPSVLLV